MTARVAALAALVLAACPDMPDAESITQDCRVFVAAELDQVRADAWTLCSEAYDDVITELEQTQEEVTRACRDAAVGGCEPFIVGWMNDYLHGQRCGYEAGRWRCAGGPLCEVP